MRKVYSRLFQFLLRLLILIQRLYGERYPATPWVYWGRFHRAYIERHDGGRTLPDQLNFFVLALWLEDSLWRPVSPSNDHQYRNLLAEISEPEALDPIGIITKAVKIHYKIQNDPSGFAILRLNASSARAWQEQGRKLSVSDADD